MPFIRFDTPFSRLLVVLISAINMAFLIFNKQLLLTPMLLVITLYGFGLGKAQTGIAGTGTGYIPLPDSGTSGGFGNNVGGGFRGIGTEDISKALTCLNGKIYSECEESYRLTESGDLHIPPDYTDQYCSGPCLKETNLVLDCINNVFSHFVFYNRATIGDVKDTIKAGCSFGSSRGNFNVADQVQANGNNSYKSSYPVVFWLLSIISVYVLLF